MADSKWRLLPKVRIKKRQALKVESIPESDPDTRKERRPSTMCIICTQKAVYRAHIQLGWGGTLVEKYCEKCLSRFVFLKSESQIV